MTLQFLLSIFPALRAKGNFVTIDTERTITLKGDAGEVVKQSTYQVMTGTAYGSRRDVREAIEAGERDMPELPIWAELVPCDNPAIRLWKHKQTGREYFVGIPSGNRGSSRWFKGGEPVEYAEIESDLYAKDKKKGEPARYVTVPIDTITAIR